MGKYTPNAAVNGEMAWTPPSIKQWKSIGRLWCRYTHMSEESLNKRIFLWGVNSSSNRIRNWPFKVKKKFENINLEHFCNVDNIYSKQHVAKSIYKNCMALYKSSWSESVNNDLSANGRGRNKLRTYRLFKHDFKTEQYLKIQMDKKYRSALAKIRCGVAPIRLETGRYEGLREMDRLCIHCNVIENEEHVLVTCPFYEDLRHDLFLACENESDVFQTFSSCDKLCFLLSNDAVIRKSAKTCYDILHRYRSFKYSQ